jgi:uncharacterized protein YndB with AHSA1/START domain
MKTIRQTYLINSSLAFVWDALTNPETIEKWGGGPAKMDDKVGTKFILWGGDIWGKNLKVIKNQFLIQEWYGSKWAKPSKVTFTLKEEGKGVKVTLLHEDVPDGEEKDIAEGWKMYYLGPIKELLEK